MKRPPLKTMLLGHPVVAMPILLASGGTIVAAFYNSNLVLLLAGVPAAMAALKANEQRVIYRQWRAEWDSMAPSPPRKRVRLRDLLVLAAVIVAVFAVLHMDSDNLQRHAAEYGGLLVGGIVILLMLVRLVRGLRARRHARPFVAKVVARPVIAVPSLDAAFRALPPYCQALMGRHP